MTVRVVLGSSVLVAALRSQLGASFRLLQELRAGRYGIALSVPLVLEYEATLLWHAEELGLAEAEVRALVDYLCCVGVAQEIHFLWRPTLRDPRDECVLELAVAAGCQAIVTHNTRDFIGADRFGVEVLTPGQFLRRLEGGR
jgi:predicted nucleic acid-binding protein